ncbi:MAG: CIA30 family protein [Candidatus Aminicenantes bacterium]|nr:CIA30 family protein [Candidatus Aminicenantes bacterium]
MKKLKKWIKYGSLALIIFFVVALLPAFFYHPEINTYPLPSHYKKGVYHLHSNFSDGKGTIEEITRSASQLNLDFVILTDHGNPNILSSSSTSWLNDVLLIGGSELSLNSGHLATAGYPVPGYILPPEPQQAIDEINHYRGISFISHPFDDKIPWTDWDIKNFTGIEVFNSYSCARKTGLFKLLIFPFRYLINQKYALLKTLFYPEKNIKKWDSVNKEGEYFAIYACDAHAILPITKKIKLHFPSYKSMFEIFHTYVKIDGKLSKDSHISASIIISALKKGQFFNVVEAIAPANGFETQFITSNGNIMEMGEKTNSTSGKIILKLPFNFKTNIVVKKNGRFFNQILKNRKKYREIKVSEPGVYRTEIFLSQKTFNHIPWIITNPYFIGERRRKPLPKSPSIKKILMNQKDFFSLESNPLSTGIINSRKSEEGEWITSFKYELKKESQKKDFWAAMARRNQFNFSSYNGFIFQARSAYRTGFWVEFRTRDQNLESWYRHSFVTDKSWSKYQIPFDKFHLIEGSEKKPNLSKIDSIFISINNAIAYPGARGTLELKNIGLY